MPAYVTASDFVLTLPVAVGSITPSSRPLNIGAVATICEQISVELDGAAAYAGYGVPIPSTATQAYSQMQLLMVRGAAAHVLNVFYPAMGQADKSSLAGDYEKAYQAALVQLRAGQMPLIDAPFGAKGTQLPRSFSTSNPTATSGVVPHFGMDWQP